MAVTIKTNMDAVRTLNMMDANRTQAYKHLNKVSTGMKVRNAQDDASAYAISERMRVRIRAFVTRTWLATQNIICCRKRRRQCWRRRIKILWTYFIFWVAQKRNDLI